MAKFCTRCGNPLPEDGSACQNCVVVQQQAAAPGKPISQMTLGGIGQSVQMDFTNEDDMAITIGGTRIRVTTIIKVIAIALCILFFLPLFSVSCQGLKLSFNGLSAAFGKTVSSFGSKSKVDGNIVAIFLLLIPAALFVAFQFKKNMSFINGKLFLISTGLSALGLIGFIALAIAVNNMAEENMVTAKFTFWYYLSIIFYIIAGLISVWCVVSAKKKTSQNNGAIPPSSNI